MRILHVYWQAINECLWLVICPVSQIASSRLDDEARALAGETNPIMTKIFQAGERPLTRKNDEKKQVSVSKTWSLNKGELDFLDYKRIQSIRHTCLE